MKLRFSIVLTAAALLTAILVWDARPEAQPPALMLGNNSGTVRPVAVNASGQLQTVVEAGSSNIGDVDVLSVVTGTGATNLGKAEDVALATGDTGVAVWGVVDATNSTQRAAAGDYSQMTADEYGAQLMRSDHPNRIRCTSGSPLAVSTATTLTVLNGCAAPGASLSIYITDITFASDAQAIAADAFPTLKYGTGGACGTGTAVFWGAFGAAATQMTITQSFTVPIKIPANNEVCWINSTAGSKVVALHGFIAP